MLTEEQKVVSYLWQCNSLIKAPPSIKNCNIEVLIEELVKAATLTSKYEPKFIEYSYFLVYNHTISWPQFLKSIQTFKNFKNYPVTIGICKFLSDILPQISIQSFSDQSDIEKLLNSISETFLWILEIIKFLNSEPIDWNYDGDDPLEQPLSTAVKFLDDKFCGSFLAIALKPEMLKNVLEIEELVKNNEEASDVSKSLAEQLAKKFKGIFTTLPYVDNNCSMSMYKMRNPSIRILTSIFVCYRILMTVEEVADAYQVFAEIMNIPFEDVVFDMIHGTLLIKAEENVDLPFLPKSRRIDFQWHVALFFYMKMTKIWQVMIKKYNRSPKDVEKAIQRVRIELKMTLDIVDVIWKDCSIRSLLENLVADKIIDEEVSKIIIDERLAQMKDVPELNKLVNELSKPENERIHNDSLIMKSSSKTALALVTKSEKLLVLLHSMVEIGTGTPFDAIIGSLCVYGKLTEYSHNLATLNIKAQTIEEEEVVDRIQTFDFSFLLLSRISIKWPSVPLKVLVNNGPTSTTAETKGIFYQWANRFLKRVKRKKKEEEAEIIEEAEMKEENKKEGNEKSEEEKKEKPENKEEKPEDKEEKPEGKEKEEEEEEDKKEKPEGNDEVENRRREEENKEEKIEEEEKKETDKKDTENEEEMKEKENDKEQIEKMEEKKEKVFDREFGVEMISKQIAAQYLQKMKEKQSFWDINDQNLNIPKLIYSMPIIGEILLEEYANKRLDRDSSKENIVNILFSLQELSCLFVCLVQWLDCQPDSVARRSLATSILKALEKCSSDTTTKWAFCYSMLKQTIQEMSEKTPAYPEVTCTAFSTARRYCPKITRCEIPDMVKLKSAWYYMQLQGWASPHALRLLEHSNCAGEYNTWSHVYVNKTIQIGCGDLMKKCVDMIFSFLMLDNFNCIIRMHESLMEFWFAEEVEQLNDGRFEPASIMPIIRLITNIMMLTAWELDDQIKKTEEGVAPLKKMALENIETPDIDDPDSPMKWIFLLENLLDVTINKFMKTIQKGLMSPVVCAICHLIKSIASSPESAAKKLLVKKIPPKLIYGISYIDPSALSYEVLEVFCDPENEEHKMEKLKFLCALRRRNFI